MKTITGVWVKNCAGNGGTGRGIGFISAAANDEAPDNGVERNGFVRDALHAEIAVMIQRIQSVYLLLVAILLVVALCLPVGQFIGPDGIAAHIFKPLGVTLADGNFQSTWGLFGILLLSAIIALCTIFLFRNRMLQVRMTVFGSLLLIGYYIAFFAFMFILKNDLNAMAFQLGWALCLPAVCIILNYLAFRAIYRDELMVKAADRLR